MTGYYAIYNHRRNAWWTQGNWWMNDTPYESYQMPTKYELTRWWTADGDEKYELQKNDLKDVVTVVKPVTVAVALNAVLDTVPVKVAPLLPVKDPLICNEPVTMPLSMIIVKYYLL